MTDRDELYNKCVVPIENNTRENNFTIQIHT